MDDPELFVSSASDSRDQVICCGICPMTSGKLAYKKDENKNVGEARAQSLQGTFNKLSWILSGFGVIFHFRSSMNGRPRLKLGFIGAMLLLFLAQLTYMFFVAIARLTTSTVIQIHFISQTQFVVSTVGAMVAFAWRSKKLGKILSAIVRADPWLRDSDWQIARAMTSSVWAYMFVLVIHAVGIVVLKVVASFGFQDRFFGIPVPAAWLTGCLSCLLVLAIGFRVIHLCMMAFISGIMGILFRRLTRTIRYEELYHATSKMRLTSADFEKILRQHFYLSQLARDMDNIFAPSVLIFVASDMVVVTSLISYFISGSASEAPLGFYVTNSTTDTATHVIHGIGATTVLLTRIVSAAYLNHQAHAIIPELHIMMQEPNSDEQLTSTIAKTLTRLRDVPVGLTGWKLFMLHKYFILTVMGLLATYLVVVVEISSKKECSLECVATMSAGLIIRNISHTV